MPARNTPSTEQLESRWFLSTATEQVHPAPHPTPALHAPANPNTATADTAESEPSDGESATPVTPTPAPIVTPSSETEDKIGSITAASTTAPPAATAPLADVAPTQPPAPPSTPPAAATVKAILTDFPSPALPTAPQASDAQLIATIFNTRRPITPQDVALQATLLTPITAASALTRTVTEVARSPLVINSATDALLSLSRTDLLASFADAITSFAHESAAAPAASLASLETHHYKWQVTLGVLGVDALLVGHWYATRRRATRASVPCSTLPF
jgi:hypothetical protein